MPADDELKDALAKYPLTAAEVFPSTHEAILLNEGVIDGGVITRGDRDFTNPMLSLSRINKPMTRYYDKIEVIRIRHYHRLMKVHIPVEDLLLVRYWPGEGHKLQGKICGLRIPQDLQPDVNLSRVLTEDPVETRTWLEKERDEFEKTFIAGCDPYRTKSKSKGKFEGLVVKVTLDKLLSWTPEPELTWEQISFKEAHPELYWLNDYTYIDRQGLYVKTKPGGGSFVWKPFLPWLEPADRVKTTDQLQQAKYWYENHERQRTDRQERRTAERPSNDQT
jgi:hypothetical protein